MSVPFGFETFKPSLQTALPVQSAFHRFDRVVKSDNVFARGFISKLLGRSIFRRNSKYCHKQEHGSDACYYRPAGIISKTK
jgi:hypothetical protein